MNRNTAILILAVSAFYLYQQGTFTKIQTDVNTSAGFSNVTGTEMAAVAGLAVGLWELV